MRFYGEAEARRLAPVAAAVVAVLDSIGRHPRLWCYSVGVGAAAGVLLAR